MEEVKDPQDISAGQGIKIEALRYLVDIVTQSLSNAQKSVANGFFTEEQVVKYQLTLINHEVQSLIAKE